MVFYPLSAFRRTRQTLSYGMPRASLTRAVEFPAGHRYHRPEWDAARNEATFGPCSRAPGHGHNYRVEVTVRGEIDPETGMIVDLAVLDRGLRLAFSGRRKRLSNSLKVLQLDWSTIDLDPGLRADNVARDEYVMLARQVATINCGTTYVE